jgi:aminobenzoyl-glutamate transport protein
MFEGKIKKKFRRRTFNPITAYFLLTLLVVVLSGIFSLFNFQTTYNVIDSAKLEYLQTTAVIENLFSFDGLKYIVSNASKMFISFAPLSMFLLAAIALAVAEASGFIDILFRKVFSKWNNGLLTFVVVLVATISSLINEVGFVIIIPLAAYIYKAKKRNPMIGVCAAFAGCAFGYGTSIFVGSLETQLIPYTTAAARMIDANFHVSLLSNLYIMIVSTVVISIVGSIVIEKIIAPKLGKYRVKKQINSLDDFEIIGEEEQEQKALTLDYNEKKGYKVASIISIIFVVFFIYSVIPGLPGSGLLLDYNEETYLKQIFGDNSYFQDGFTFMVSLLFIISGLVYGFVSKKFKNNTDVLNSCKEPLSKIGTMLLLLFVASIFIGVFKKTNIGTVITGVFANILSTFSFSGIAYLLIAIIIMIICDLFLTGVQAKWIIFSPVIVPALMKANITPQFTQFVMRFVDSMGNGISPLYAYFVIFIGYMNIYNMNEEKPVTISAAIRLMFPYFVIICLTWLLLLIGWYIIGLPIGPGVFPTV